MATHKLPDTKDLSSFGLAALRLDNDFSELERLSAQIDRLSIESDSGMGRAREILAKVGDCGQRIAEGVQNLAKTLEEARARAEKAAMNVSARANLVQERHFENERMLEKFKALAEKVRGVTTSVGELKKPGGAGLSEEEKKRLPAQMADFDSRLSALIEEANQLKESARESRMKTLEKNADALGQSLQSARRKLSAYVQRA